MSQNFLDPDFDRGDQITKSPERFAALGDVADTSRGKIEPGFRSWTEVGREAQAFRREDNGPLALRRLQRVVQ